jgi:hypothetical protein
MIDRPTSVWEAGKKFLEWLDSCENPMLLSCSRELIARHALKIFSEIEPPKQPTCEEAKEKFEDFLADLLGTKTPLAIDRKIADKAAELFAGVKQPDPPIVRLQFPDGSVPEDLQECAEGWKREYDFVAGKYDTYLKAMNDQLDLDGCCHIDSIIEAIRELKDQQPLEVIEGHGQRVEEAVSAFAGYVITCKKENTDDWMQGLASQVNELCEIIGDDDRFGYDGERLLTSPRPTFAAPPKPELVLVRTKANGHLVWVFKEPNGVRTQSGYFWGSETVDLIYTTTGQPIDNEGGVK